MNRLIAAGLLTVSLASAPLTGDAQPTRGGGEIALAAASSPERSKKATKAAPAKVGKGKASFYGRSFAGRRTASGQRYDPAKMTAAHRSLPLGTKAKVTNVENGKSVTVTINDRGPHKRGRIIDLSRAAAQRLDMVSEGLAEVSVQPLP